MPFGIVRFSFGYRGLQILFLVEILFVIQKRLLASGTENVFRIYGIVKIDLFAAVRAHCAVELAIVLIVVIRVIVAMTATAAAIVIVTIVVIVIAVVTAAAAIVFVAVDKFLDLAQILIDFLDIVVEGFGVFLQRFDFACHLLDNTAECFDDLIFRLVSSRFSPSVKPLI